ncbi:MAG: hypothetical protein U5K79_11925 [Cyclobacteriaceae bacterium]|nr:hypothetical protein [Cyclobacteriaceae bacterium]
MKRDFFSFILPVTWITHGNADVITNWDYRWEFSGNGSINSEVVIHSFAKRQDGNYEVSYSHIKYGDGAILLDKDFHAIGKVLKPAPLSSMLQLEGDFPALLIQTSDDIGVSPAPDILYLLKWETLPRNRDKPRPEPAPGRAASSLYLYKLTR